MSKRPREDDPDDVDFDISQDAVSIVLSDLKPTSSPVHISNPSSPVTQGGGDDSVAYSWQDDDFSTQCTQDVTQWLEQAGGSGVIGPNETHDLSVNSLILEASQESFMEQAHEYFSENRDSLQGERSHDVEDLCNEYGGCERSLVCGDGVDNDDAYDGLSINSDDGLGEEPETDFNSECKTKKDTPLYEDAQITIDESLLAVLTYAVRHNLNGVAVVNLLELISLHCKKVNAMTPTLYFFKKHFSHLKAPVTLHHFCSLCHEPLPNSKSQCSKSLEHRGPTQLSFFMEISLENQIQTLFKRKGFLENMQHRFSRKKLNPDNIEDIYDSQLYREQCDRGFLSENGKLNYSLTWNTDGVPVFKSSKTSMWPIYFVINELPFELRYKKENILLGGIWYGSKPELNLMLEPFTISLKKLRKGIQVQPYGSSEKFTSKGVLLVGTADLPAKADLMGIKHTGGSFSCAVCKVEGKSVKVTEELYEDPRTSSTTPAMFNNEEDSNDPAAATARRWLEKHGKKQEKQRGVASVWVFPYSNQVDLRRHDEMDTFAKEALTRRQAGDDKAHVFGVKWPTYVSKIMPDMIRGFGIDDLHHTYHGVFHKLLELWTLPKYKKKPWSIHNKLALVDDRLKKVRLPNFVQCGIRSVTNLSLWKGLHYKIFMLNLALPILEDVLPDVYFDHFAGLVHCVFILNSSSICPNDLLFCSEALDSFVKNFQNLYGVRHMTINIHNTLHLAFVCTNLGPMRCYSCFPFESLNGELLKMIHGTRFVEIQLANCAYYVMSLSHEIQTCGSSKVQEFASKLHYSHQRTKLLEPISGNLYAAGNYIGVDSLTDHVKFALQASGINMTSCKVFTKLKKTGILYVAQCYHRITKTASCFVSYLSGSVKCYGMLLCFIKASCHAQCKDTCKCKTMFYAVIQQANTRRFSTAGIFSKKINHIFRYVLQERVQLISVDELLHICFSISVAGKDPFLSERVNWLELE